jgi:hypothetical protein
MSMNLASHTTDSTQRNYVVTRAKSVVTQASAALHLPKSPRDLLAKLWQPGVLGVVCAGILASGLGACDSTAKIGLSDRKFYAIEAVSVFPAQFDSNHKFVGRVCGGPLLGADGKEVVPTGPDGLPVVEPAANSANGMEVTANFISSSLNKPACSDDQDTSIKKGESIEQTALTVPNTVSVGNFQFGARCTSAVHLASAQTTCTTDAQCDDGSQCTDDTCEPTVCTADLDCGSAGPCVSGNCTVKSCVHKPQSSAQTISASTVQYKSIAGRCDPNAVEDTRINVALVIDNSGSMKGNIDAETYKEDADGKYDPAPQPLTGVASDWFGYRFNAAEAFISSLNPNDRVIGYVYDELGVKVASSDSFICTGTGNPQFDNNQCRPEDPGTCPSPGTCDSDPTLTNDSYSVGLEGAECLAFGSNESSRIDLANGLELKRNGASGRGPLWKTIDTAFTFLNEGRDACQFSVKAKHIVVMADGPDTCVDSDEFSYMSLRNKDTSGICRTKCATSDVKWRELMIKMASLNYPVHVHFVQFQAPGYKEPDPRMIEMACRTDGTYQFINSENFNKSAQNDFSNALTRAITRVRNGLAGTWRVGFEWTSITSEQEFPKGGLRAMDGDFLFTNNKFESLDPAVNKLAPDAWRFTQNGAEDRRALMRIPCSSDADCGGAGGSCGANHCGEGGECRVDQAPNGEPCLATGGAAGTCRAGACLAGQKCNDAIKP